jgi:hypothetical protein
MVLRELHGKRITLLYTERQRGQTPRGIHVIDASGQCSPAFTPERDHLYDYPHRNSGHLNTIHSPLLSAAASAIVVCEMHHLMWSALENISNKDNRRTCILRIHVFSEMVVVTTCAPRDT